MREKRDLKAKATREDNAGKVKGASNLVGLLCQKTRMKTKTGERGLFRGHVVHDRKDEYLATNFSTNPRKTYFVTIYSISDLSNYLNTLRERDTVL